MNRRWPIILPLIVTVLTACGGSQDSASPGSSSAIVAPAVSLTPPQTSSDNSTPQGPPIGTFVQPKDIVVFVDRDRTTGKSAVRKSRRSKVADTVADDTDVGWFTRYGPSNCGSVGVCWKEASIGYTGHMWWTWNNKNSSATYQNYGEWAPYLDCPGNYSVSAYIPGNNATTKKAPYTITHANGTDSATLNQYGISNQWASSFGTYAFKQTGASVILKDITGETTATTKIGFDAMKWKWVSPTATLTVTSPNGGETWNKSGSGCIDVTWNSSGLSDKVRIHLYKDGIIYKSLSSGASNDGSYCVQKADLSSVPAGSSYTIGMSNVSSYCDGTVYDFSNNSFTITSGSPNLKFYTPSGWSGPVVVTNTSGSKTSSSSLKSENCGTTYISWAIENSGTANASSTFYTKLYLDGNLLNTWNTPSLNSGSGALGENYSTKVSQGVHTLQIVTDTTGVISESNENDNTFTQNYTWDACGAPPSVNITSPNNGNSTFTGNTAEQVGGTCSSQDGSGVASVNFVNSATGGSKTINVGGAGSYNFSSNMSLVYGANPVTVTCTSGSGFTGNDAITITRNTPPSVNITSPGNGTTINGSSVDLFGKCGDTDSNLDLVKFKNISTGYTKDTSISGGSWSGSMTIPLQSGSNVLQVECWDTTATNGQDQPAVASISVTSNQAPTTGTISGTVTAAGSALGGATVSVAGPATKSVTADSGGNYSITGLPAGIYDIKAGKSGYFDQTKSGISVSAGATTTVNFALTKIPSAGFYYSPSNISVTMGSGSMNSTQTFVVKNTGDAQLNYTPTTNVNWAIIQKNGATITGKQLSLAPGAQDSLTVVFNSNGITSSQSGTVTLSHNDPAQGAQSLFLGMGINAQPPPSSPPAFQPSLYGQCQLQNACYADPVNTAIGNYTYHYTDIVISARGPDLIFARSYNSLDVSLGPLGLGWNHSLNSQIITAGNGDAFIRWGNGRVDKYTWNGNGFTPPAGITAILTKGNNYILADSEQTTWLFSLEGQIHAITDRHNNKLLLAYDTQNRLVIIINTLGESLTLNYLSPTDPKLASVTDFTGRKMKFAYSGNLLTQVTDVMGKSFGFAYDSGGRLNQITERDGKVIVTNNYDADGRVVQQTDANGNLTTFAYNTPGAGQTTVTDPTGLKHLYAYDALYRLITQTAPTGDKVSYLYNTLDLPVEVTDANGQKTASTYDNHGNLTTVTDATGAKWLWTYDSADRMTSHTTPLGQTYSYSYDTNGNLSQVTTTVDGIPHDASYTYLPTGEVTGITDPMGFATQLAYTGKGELQSVTNANSETSQFAVDALHRTTALTDALSRTWNYAYDADDHLVSATTPLGQKTTYTYDARGQLTDETRPEGKLSRSYDAAGLLTSFATPEGTTAYIYNTIHQLVSETDPAGHKTSYSYNALGYLAGITDPTGKSVSFSYDPMGHLLSGTDTAGQKTVFTVDALGQTTKITDPLGNAIGMTYNAEGRVTQVTDPADNIFKTIYDGIGRKVQSINPTNRSVLSQYDKNSRVTQLTTPRKTVYSWAYDKMGRILSQTNPGGSKTSYTYDVAGQLTSFTDAANKKTSIGYDADGKPTQVAFADGVARTITYDAANRPTQITLNNKTRSYTYDAAGRIASTTDIWGKTITYNYTTEGWLASVTCPGNKTVSYGYDASGRLVSVKDWLGGTTSYTYDAAGRLQQTTYPNGVKTTRAYDANSRITSLTHKKADGSLILSQVMTYDSRGNVTSIDTTPEPAGWLKAKYTTYEVNAGDQYTTIDGWLLLGYDPVGQLLTKDVDGQEPSSYTFDVRGRLTSATAAGDTTAFAYGPEGERIEKAAAAKTTRYVVDTNAGLPRVALELDASSAPSTYYIYGLGLVARVAATGSGVQYYLEDVQQNIAALTDAAGAVTDTYFYHPFGRVLAKTGTTPNPYQFAGHLGVEQDETGLLYMRARYYDPTLERFISRDPLGISAGDVNLYAYVHNNPTGYSDPNGLWLDVFLDITFIAFDIYNLVTDPSWDNAAALGLDVVGAVVPVATGLGATYKASKTAVHVVEETTKVEKIVSKFDNVALDTAKSSKAGKLGNAATKEHVFELGETATKNDYEIIGGGGVKKELYIPGPAGGTKGSAYPDLSLKKNGKVTHVNTVSTYADNFTPIPKEAEALSKIKKLDPTSDIIQIPKPKPLKGFSGGKLPEEMLMPKKPAAPDITGLGAGYIATKNYFNSLGQSEGVGK